MQDLVDVTKGNFNESLPVLEDALRTCNFVAFDCEMTGLFLEDNNIAFVDDMTARYDKMYKSAKAFTINQFGISTFSLRGGKYEAKTFNFNLFPRGYQSVDKRFTCQSSSLAYLAQHKFDFNKMIYEGIPFMTLEQEAFLLKGLDKEPRQNPVPLSNQADIDFVKDLKEQVIDWYRLTKDQTLELTAGMNPFRRLIAYQGLETLSLGGAKWPGFYTEKLGQGGGAGIVLTRATRAEADQRKADARARSEQGIRDAAGFSHVMLMIRDAKKPVVGHNMFFDVVYTLNMFVGDFERWQSFKGASQRLFTAGIFDTKHLCKVLLDEDPSMLEETSLGPLFEALQLQEPSDVRRALLDEAADGSDWYAPPVVQHAPGFTRYSGALGAQYAHEAGYDAYMTGACFTQLLALFSALAAKKARTSSTPTLINHPSRQPCARVNMATNLQAFQLHPIAYMKGRVNMMRSDIPFVSLCAPDFDLRRSNSFVIFSDDSGMIPSAREIKQLIGRNVTDSTGNLKMDRIDPMDGSFSGCMVTLSSANASQVILTNMEALRKAFSPCAVGAWPEFASWKAGEGNLTSVGGAADGKVTGGPRRVATNATAPANKRQRPSSPQAPSKNPDNSNCSIM